MEIIDVALEHEIILEIRGQRVMITPFKSQEIAAIGLGVQAPPEIAVNREEIYKKKKLKMKTSCG